MPEINVTPLDATGRCTHLVVHYPDYRILACCGWVHEHYGERCDVADNWVLVRPPVHSTSGPAIT